MKYTLKFLFISFLFWIIINFKQLITELCAQQLYEKCREISYTERSRLAWLTLTVRRRYRKSANRACCFQRVNSYIHQLSACVSDNGPPPVEQSDDGWLNFTKITRAESGWYKCYTRHMLGIFTSIGYFLNVRCE